VQSCQARFLRHLFCPIEATGFSDSNTMKRHKLTCLLAALLALATTGGAVAHPHVFSTMRTMILADDVGHVKAVGVEWLFDENYTQFALEGLDLNNNGAYEPEEIQPLTDENIKNLLESQYFTFLRQNGKLLEQGPVTQYGQDLDDGRLKLFFIVPLKQPADPRTGAVELKVYDPDFFIAFDYEQTDAVRLQGKLPDGCKMDLKPLPSTEDMDQTRNFLADKGTDWTPEQPTDFGSMFAQALVVSCG
jgi:ABC-type uncharacterized transport system substrate-binding protein